MSYEIRGNRRALFSEYTEIKSNPGFGDVSRTLHSMLESYGDVALRDNIEGLANFLTDVVHERGDAALHEEPSFVLNARGPYASLQRVAYYASMFLESQFFVLQNK